MKTILSVIFRLENIGWVEDCPSEGHWNFSNKKGKILSLNWYTHKWENGRGKSSSIKYFDNKEDPKALAKIRRKEK